jgi:hypothetical protein
LIPKRDLSLVGGIWRSQALEVLNNGGEREYHEMKLSLNRYLFGEEEVAYKGPRKK